MIIVATQKNIRQTPRKVRLVANQVKSLGLEQALKQLAVIEKRATVAILKVLRQALANAEHNHNLKFEDLELKNIEVMEGPTYKRWNAVSRGRAHSILKRSCHVRVELEKSASPADQPAPSAGKPAAKKAEVKKQPKTKAKVISKKAKK